MPDLEQRTLFDVTTIRRYVGPRMSKCAQTTDKAVDYHVYPSGRKVIKAFTANDFQFFDVNDQVVKNYQMPPLMLLIEFVLLGAFKKIARIIRR